MQIKCTSCGATQELAANNQCGFCGSAIEQEKAQENYKASSTGEVGNLMMMAETAVDATNWEEALQYYNRVLEKDISNSDAWLGKGIAIVYTSKIGEIKTKEAIAYWKNAIKHANNPNAMGKRVAKEINTVVNSFYPAIENHYIEFNDLDNSYQELVSRFATLETTLNYATELDKKEINYPETGYELCKRVISIPSKIARTSSNAAWAEGIVGQFSNNEYSRKFARENANEKLVKAERRKGEIAAAAKVIKGLISKYIGLIAELDPNHYAVKEFQESVEVNSLTEEKLKVKESKQRFNTFTLMVVILLFIIGMGLGSTNEAENKEEVQLLVGALSAFMGYLLTKVFWKQIDKMLPRKN